MGTDTTAIILAAEQLGRAIELESSLDLKPVVDVGSGIKIPPWRRLRGAREHAIHSMMSRVGGFPPALARYFVALYTRPKDVVADPFCGKGTALLEALSLGRDAAGSDIAPEAVVVSRAKCLRLSVAKVASYIESLTIPGTAAIDDTPDAVRAFYCRRTLAQILEVRRQVLEDIGTRRRRDAATFVCGTMLGILHGHSAVSLSVPCNQAFAMSPGYVRRYVKEHHLKRPVRDLRRSLMDRALTLLPAPKIHGRSVVREVAAESFSGYVKRSFGSAHLILSSPPYLDRQTYVKDAWLRLWFLGRERRDISRRSMETGNVTAFAEAMKAVLVQMDACLAEGGRIVLVCGQANRDVGGKRRAVRVADLVLYTLRQDGAPKLTVERAIRDRKLMTRGSYFAVHHGKTNGDDGVVRPRYGEDEIIVLRRP